MKSNSNKRGLTWLALAIMLLPVVGLVGLDGCKKQDKPAPKPAAPTVTVEKVVLQTVPIHLRYVATTESVRVVDIRARVEGFLEERRFVEGADVRKGDVVFVIEKEPYEAALKRSLAELSRDKASLAFAREQVARYRPLAEQDFVTQESLDEYETSAREGEAAVKADLAQIAQDRLNLSYCTMRSPLNGRIGRTLVNVGNLVGGGEENKLATIVQLDPIYVYFSPSEKDLRLILKHRQQTDIPVDVILSDGSTYPYPGKVDFIDNKADPMSNTVNMRAVIPNPEKTLLPGVYVTASLFLCNVSDTALISEKAIAEDQTGMYVYVVGAEHRVEKRAVQAGFLYDHRKIIWKGLKAGEWIITDGLQMVRPGMTVRPRVGQPDDQQKTDKTAQHLGDKPSISSTDHGKPGATQPDAKRASSDPSTARK